MAIIETNTKSSLHLRSNSLPSTSHPLISQFEVNLQRLNTSEAASSSESSSSICNKLNGMQDLHDCIDNLLQLPNEQQTLAQECNEKCIDDLLEGSLRILDICSIAKDCLLMALRKNMKKQIRKALVNLKAIKLIASSSNNNNDNNSSTMFRILKEAETVTISSLEHLLLFICDPKGHSNNRRWSAISKLMHSKRVVCDSQELDTNEFEKVDAALLSLINHKSLSTENYQSHMEDLEMCIQDLEIGVEQISRKLIRNRVSLLNIFNH